MGDAMNYERLFDILREERTIVKLQQLPEDFFASVSEYLGLKSGSGDQLKNAKRIVSDIYERREKKIFNLALSKSRTKSNLIDTSALLPEEQIFFKQTVILLDHFRDDILEKVLEGQMVQEKAEIPTVEEGAEIQETPEAAPEEAPVVEEVPQTGNVRVKFKQFCDKFVGPDLEIMGPYEEGDVAELPRAAAEIVVSKELAEEFGEEQAL